MYTDETIHFTDIYLKTTSKERDREREKYIHRDNERKSEQAHIPHAPTLLENAVYNEWQFQSLGTGNRTKKGI